MRLFVGIEFPPAIIDALTGCQQALRQHSERGRFKRVENFHLTLKFLGEVPTAAAAGLIEPLKKAAHAASPFNINLGKFGQFGSGNPIRTVWVDVGGDTAQLFALQAAVEVALAGAGFPRENRPWRPHITLAQDVILKPGAPPWHTYNIAAGSFAVEEFALVLSEERDRRRVYTPINRFILGR